MCARAPARPYEAALSLGSEEGRRAPLLRGWELSAEAVLGLWPSSPESLSQGSPWELLARGTAAA